MKDIFIKYILYLIRWQLSTPILFICISFISVDNALLKTTIANFIGGLIFFWVDKYIFTNNVNEIWEIKYSDICCDCNIKYDRLYRLVQFKRYNKSNDLPKFRCEKCSIIKFNNLNKKGLF